MRFGRHCQTDGVYFADQRAPVGNHTRGIFVGNPASLRFVKVADARKLPEAVGRQGGMNARVLLARHDLITPTLGRLPWFEKPPLLYWMTMASYRVFGVNDFSARLGPAICALLTAVFIYWIAASVRDPDGQAGWGGTVREG